MKRDKKSIPLKDYSNEELIALLDMSEVIANDRLGCLCAEILKRLNQIKPLFEEETQ